jgi:hypothetical protein
LSPCFVYTVDGCPTQSFLENILVTTNPFAGGMGSDPQRVEDEPIVFDPGIETQDMFKSELQLGTCIAANSINEFGSHP